MTDRDNASRAPGWFRKVGALGLGYVLGVFNDNFYKQAALLLAVQAGLAGLQSQATLLFALPFVLLSPAAGWLADRYPKKSLIVWAKAIEIVAMLMGAWGLITLDWFWILAMVFGMGFNSTLFSPALNGSIPELFAEADVPRVNGFFKLATTVAILLGIALAGTALDWQGGAGPEGWGGRHLVAGVALLVAVLGFFSVLGIPRRPGAGGADPFPWLAVVDMLRYLCRLRHEQPSLYVVLWAEAFFYGLSTLFLLEINRLGVAQMGFSLTATSLLSVGLMAGICVGALLAGRGTCESWRRVGTPCLAGMACCLCAVMLVPHLPSAWAFPCLLALYALSGTCGGLYLIPLTSFLQARSPAAQKGRVLGLANTLDFSAILVAGYLYPLLDLLSPSVGHGVLGGMAGLAAVGLALSVRGRNKRP